MTDANYYAQLITSDPEFLKAVRQLDSESLRVEIKYAVAGLAAAENRRSPAGTPLSDLEAITSAVTEIVLQTPTLANTEHR